MNSRIGMKVGSRYNICEVIGAGVCGSVYGGIDTVNSNNVAIKFENESGIWLANEIRAYYRLNNVAGVPEVFWHGTEHQENILVIERLGSTVSDVIRRNQYRAFDLNTTANFALKLVTLIQAIHSFNIIHGDIHVGNVMLGTGTNSNVVYLIDFGFAKVVDNIATSSSARFSRKKDLCDAGDIFYRLSKGYSKDALVPAEFVKYMNYCSGLQIEQTPDYDFIKDIFKKSFQFPQFPEQNVFNV